MKRKLIKILYWSPRILGILFIAFISLFALDVFSTGYTFHETVVALLIHLIPTIILIFALLIAWEWEMIGGIIYIVLGLCYIAGTWGKFGLATYLIIAGPLILIGLLFIVNKFIKDK